VLAQAQLERTIAGHVEGHRGELGARVRAVAEGLAL
jgi:hypothetical protein